MAYPLIWPGEYKFYLIGNTPAVSLTRDLPPDVPANILSLPSGDFRNVLYTVFCESPSMQRKLDFTCGDHDPGILARNILLLTMIFDDVAQIAIWDIYLHMYLDNNSHAVLLGQCRKLLACSASLEDWHTSPYGTFLRVGTTHTLLELRRLWSAYVDSIFPVGSPHALATLNMIDTGRKQIAEFNSKYRLVGLSARSSGPLVLDAKGICTDLFHHYWRTGTTYTATGAPVKTPHANPTFLHSRRGEGFRLHHATDPLTPFHLAPLFGNRIGTLSIQEAVVAAQAELQQWCRAFRAQAKSSQGSLTVCFLLGDAMNIAHALSTWNASGIPSPVPVAPWTSTSLELCVTEYRDRCAPTLFDVVDTSNLSDGVEVLHILLFAIPLLSTSAPWSGVLYTESLQTQLSGSASHLSSLLPADMSVIALLLGFCPVDALSSFTSACFLSDVMPGAAKDGSELYHYIFTWKRPNTSELHAQASSSPAAAPSSSLHIDPQQLASILCDTYDRLFPDESPNYVEDGQDGASKEKRQSSREMFVLFLRLVRMRCPIPDMQWIDVIERFINRVTIVDATTKNPISGRHGFSLYHPELSAQMHRHQVYTFPAYLIPLRGVGPLTKWITPPPLLRIYLTVPQESFAVLRRRTDITPIFLCVVRNDTGECGFQSVNATFGTIADKGTRANSTAVIREAAGGLGTDSGSSLVVSFALSAWTLTNLLRGPGSVIVDLCVKSGPDTAYIDAPPLVQRLDVFSARLNDAEHVHIVAEDRQPPIVPAPSSHAPISTTSAGVPMIGTQSFVHADLDVNTGRVTFLTARLLVQDAITKTMFTNGAVPTVTQPSPFTIRFVFDGRAQDLVYPLPVMGGQSKTRLARKSSYIEVVVPVAMPFPKVWAMESNPFPAICTSDTVFPWNLPRISLDRSPTVDVAALRDPAQKWFYPHICSQFSYREGKMMGQGTPEGLTIVKEAIRIIMLKFTGVQGAFERTDRYKVFALQDKTTRAFDTVFFVSELRYDLACHTVVCDAFVLLLSDELRVVIDPWYQAVVAKGGIATMQLSEDELRTWKQLLPGLVERCRTTWKHGENCEYAAQGKIPLERETMAGDPLCSCGRGKDVDGMHTIDAWKNLAPFVTRIALSPLFAVPYLEPVFDREFMQRMRQAVRSSGLFGPNPGTNESEITRCAKCSKSGGDLSRCSRCKAVFYCSEGCQKADWKSHRASCAAKS